MTTRSFLVSENDLSVLADPVFHGERQTKYARIEFLSTQLTFMTIDTQLIAVLWRYLCLYKKEVLGWLRTKTLATVR